MQAGIFQHSFCFLVILHTQYHICVPLCAGHKCIQIFHIDACIIQHFERGGKRLRPAICRLSAGALGGALADILSGYAIWAIPTMIIKMLNVLPFALMCRKHKSNKILSKSIVLITIISGVITILGYFIAECILYSVASATLSLIGNTIQAVASGIIFIILATSLDKINLKSKLSKGA